jgi:hypothetical protein
LNNAIHSTSRSNFKRQPIFVSLWAATRTKNPFQTLNPSTVKFPNLHNSGFDSFESLIEHRYKINTFAKDGSFKQRKPSDSVPNLNHSFEQVRCLIAPGDFHLHSPSWTWKQSHC